MTDRNMGSSSFVLMIDDLIDSPTFLKFIYGRRKNPQGSFFVFSDAVFDPSTNSHRKSKNAPLARKKLSPHLIGQEVGKLHPLSCIVYALFTCIDLADKKDAFQYIFGDRKHVKRFRFFSCRNEDEIVLDYRKLLDVKKEA